MGRKLIAALGVLALSASACVKAEEPTRAVAKPGQIVTVIRGERGQTFGPVAVDRDGTLYAGDYGDNVVVKVPRRGEQRTVIAESTRFPAPLSAEKLFFPNGLAVDGAGTVYVSSFSRLVVLAVTRAGKPMWVAGSTDSGNFAPASGPAHDVNLTVPGSLALDRAGNLYIDNGRTVARLDRQGQVTTVAGTGAEGHGGDGGPATSAQLKSAALALDDADNLYIGDDTLVRRVDGRGIIETIAGSGEGKFSGDGGPARQAGFDPIEGVTVDRAGDIFVSGGNRVREITPDGIVRTVAGTGEKGYSGDGGPAAQARLNGPSGLAVDADGNLYIADDANFRVRMVGLARRR